MLRYEEKKNVKLTNWQHPYFSHFCWMVWGAGKFVVKTARVYRALLEFDRWQSINEGLPLRSVKYHLSSIGGVEASKMEVLLDGISPSSFGVTPWTFPAMNVWVEVKDSSYMEGGFHAEVMSILAGQTSRYLLAALGTVVVLLY